MINSAEISTPQDYSDGTPKIPLITSSTIPEYLTTSSLTVLVSVSNLKQSEIKTLTCQFNLETPIDCSSGSFTKNNLGEGAFQIKIVAESIKNLKSEKTLTFVRDVTAPDLVVVEKPAQITNELVARFTFSATDNVSQVESIKCSLNGAVATECVSPYNSQTLTSGEQDFKVYVKDRAGNEALAYSYQWSINTAVPAVIISEKPPQITQSRTARFEFGGAATYECKLNQENFSACVSPLIFENLNGDQKLTIRGKSLAGVSSAEIAYDWTVDFTKPVINVTSSPPVTTDQTSGRFEFSATDSQSGIATTMCQLNNETMSACASPIVVDGLSNQSHTMKILVTDSANNSTEFIYTWTVAVPEPVLASESFYKAQAAPPAGYPYSVRLNVPGKVNFYLSQLVFDPLAPIHAYLGIKNNAKIDLGKLSSGSSTATITMKIINDTAQTVSVPSPTMEASPIAINFANASFPISVPARSETTVKFIASTSGVGDLSKGVSWNLSNSEKLNFKILLNSK